MFLESKSVVLQTLPSPHYFVSLLYNDLFNNAVGDEQNMTW